MFEYYSELHIKPDDTFFPISGAVCSSEGDPGPQKQSVFTPFGKVNKFLLT